MYSLTNTAYKSLKKARELALFLMLFGIGLSIYGYLSNEKNILQTLTSSPYFGLSALICFSLGCCILDLFTHFTKINKNIFTEYIYQYNPCLIAFEIFVSGFFTGKFSIFFMFFISPSLINKTSSFNIRVFSYIFALIAVFGLGIFSISDPYTMLFIVSQGLLMFSAFISILMGVLNMELSDESSTQSHHLEFLGKQMLVLTLVGAIIFNQYINHVDFKNIDLHINWCNWGQQILCVQCLVPYLFLSFAPNFRKSPKGLLISGSWIFFWSFVAIYWYIMPVAKRTTPTIEEIGIFLTLFAGFQFLFWNSLYRLLKTRGVNIES